MTPFSRDAFTLLASRFGFWCGVAILAVLAACERAERSDRLAEQTAIATDRLPLRLGFYVSSDTPCEHASNATLSLLRRNGIGGARDFCEFKSIERVEPDVYRVMESCADLRDDYAETSVVTYFLAGDTGFRARSESGWEHRARHCPQSALPEEWRDADIGELLD
ncbi:MAG: hypothetical protein IT469_02965 [Pseudomonadales bacterium]|nr:hypothetical protein [Pseudomonadales bacterium]HMM73368.1 hypothetical protein [Rhodocyclaceae bacterium]